MFSSSPIHSSGERELTKEIEQVAFSSVSRHDPAHMETFRRNGSNGPIVSS